MPVVLLDPWYRMLSELGKLAREAGLPLDTRPALARIESVRLRLGPDRVSTREAECVEALRSPR